VDAPDRPKIVLTPIGVARNVAQPSTESRRSNGKEGPTHMLHAIINFFRRDEEGQGLAEYALILALIAIVAIIALIFLGGQVKTILSTVGASV
jgi:pilus assembly protein Flp/PilA